MPTNYTVKDVDHILNTNHMPSDLVLLIDGLVFRILELSDNRSLFDMDDALEGLADRKARRGVLEEGTYSSGTLRDEDMISMFNVIGGMTKCEVCLKKSHLAWSLDRSANDHEIGCLAVACVVQDEMRDQRSYLIEELFDHVNENHCPPDYYFGSIEGDASDFGVWHSDDRGENSMWSDDEPVDEAHIHKGTPQQETPDSRMFEVSVRYFTNNPDLTGEMVSAIAQEALESVLIGDDWYKYLKVVG